VNGCAPPARWRMLESMVSSDSGPIRLAILDNDSGFVRVLVNRADSIGWQHRHLESAPPAEELAAMRVNALVVDLGMLGPSAWSFLEQVAGAVPELGIVVVTGRSSVAQRVRGLRLGADDWISKPCHPEEVLARVEAVTRRRRQANARIDQAPVVAAELSIRADQFQAFAGGRSVELTRREFEVLQLLAGAEGKARRTSLRLATVRRWGTGPAALLR